MKIKEEKEIKKNYRYFISYSLNTSTSFGYGNLEYKTNNKIKSIYDIQEMSDSIMKQFNLRKIIIINFILLEDE